VNSIKVIVFGGSGMLGKALVPYLSSEKYVVIQAGRSMDMDIVLDVQDNAKVTAILNAIKPDVVINLIASTDVDWCEMHLASAMQTNALIPAGISKAIDNCINPSIHFVHISTDQVYSGTGGHVEEHVCPVNVYGLTKLTGELMIECANYSILRTNFFGKNLREGKASLSDWIYSSINSLEPITLFNDVVFNAVFIGTLCSYINLFIQRKIYGTFNVGSRNGISKADFAFAFSSRLGKQITNVAVRNFSSDLLIAKRPLNMATNVKKFETAGNLVCPDIMDEIRLLSLQYS